MVRPICGADHRGGVCTRVAGWRTEHPGIGHCSNHETSEAVIMDTLLEPRIKTLVEQFRRDKDPFELRDEIAICRAMISELFDQITDDAPEMLIRVSPPVNQLLNTLGKLVQRLDEIEHGRKYVIHVDLVQQTLQRVLAIVVEHVPDAAIRSAIADEISAISIGGEPPKALTAPGLTQTQQSIVSTAKSLVSK